MMFDRQNTVYVGNLGPIPLFVHWSVLVMVYLLYTGSMSGGRFHFDFFLISLTVLIIGIVLHELGHGMTAKALGAFGVTITLWAFGGVCSSTRDSLPRRELLIIAAGPAVSFILAGLGYLGLEWMKAEHPEWLVDAIGRKSLIYLFVYFTYVLNLRMGLFNSLPMYPLDGGQIVYNLVLAVSGKQLLARKVSLFLAVVGAFAFIGYEIHLNNDQFDQSMIYIVALMGWLVFNAYRYLH